MSEQQDWQVAQLNRLLAAILKKTGPVVLTNDDLRKSDGKFRAKERGYGIEAGFAYYAQK